MYYCLSAAARGSPCCWAVAVAGGGVCTAPIHAMVG